jgi:GABA(A) receptor-associated protein
MSEFKKNHPFEKRKAEALRIKAKYPDRIPVIIENADNTLRKLDKKKYLVPMDLTAGQLIYIVRKRIKLAPEEAVFVFINNTLPPSGMLISQLYEEHRDEDGFMYATISSESCFGLNT